MSENTKALHDKTFPNESSSYREARNALLLAEQALRSQTEAVAQLRRALPDGGEVATDYEFQPLACDDDGEGKIRFSELFGPNNDLLVYSYMFGPDWGAPCPSCTSVIDGLNAMARHVERRASLAVVAKAPVERLEEIAAERSWTDVRLLSSFGCDYQLDYRSETPPPDSSFLPVMNVFVRRGGRVFHRWASELLWTPIPGGHPRHVDPVWPLWNLLDLVASGRGESWQPQLYYD